MNFSKIFPDITEFLPDISTREFFFHFQEFSRKFHISETFYKAFFFNVSTIFFPTLSHLQNFMPSYNRKFLSIVKRTVKKIPEKLFHFNKYKPETIAGKRNYPRSTAPGSETGSPPPAFPFLKSVVTQLMRNKKTGWLNHFLYKSNRKEEENATTEFPLKAQIM